MSQQESTPAPAPEVKTEAKVEAPKAEAAQVPAPAAPPAADPAADLAKLIDAAVAAKTAPFVQAATVAQLANDKKLSLPAANAVSERMKQHPSLSFEQALALARAESPKDFEQGYQPRHFNFLPVGGESAMREKAGADKTNEQKYEEAIDFANNGQNGSVAAGKAVMTGALKQYLDLQVSKQRGVLVQ